MLPCDFTVASQKHLSAVIVIFSSTIHHISELKCNNSLFKTISLFLCLSCNNHSSLHCRSEKYQSRRFSLLRLTQCQIAYKVLGLSPTKPIWQGIQNRVDEQLQITLS